MTSNQNTFLVMWLARFRGYLVGNHAHTMALETMSRRLNKLAFHGHQKGFFVKMANITTYWTYRKTRWWTNRSTPNDCALQEITAQPAHSNADAQLFYVSLHLIRRRLAMMARDLRNMITSLVVPICLPGCHYPRDARINLLHNIKLIF